MTDAELNGSGRKLGVLIVDDHDVVHWGFRLLFSQQPWVTRCLSARSMEEAIGHTRRFEPHVALVDLFVGEESGAEICERLRQETHMPVYTAENPLECVAIGAGRSLDEFEAMQRSTRARSSTGRRR